MAVQNFFVLTPEERSEAISHNTSDAAVSPRPIDNSSPGIGINLNDAAADYEAGDIVALAGCFVAPKRIVDDATYPAEMKAFLLTLPFCSLETETIFAPPDPDA